MSTLGICAITGANGYVGSAIASYFSRKGYRIVALTRREPSSEFDHIPFSLENGLEPGALRKRRVDVIIHCAYDFGPVSWADIKRVNVDGTRRLFQAAKHEGVSRIIVVSTISAFAGCSSLYGKAKLEMEAAARYVNASIVRPGLVYGQNCRGGMFGRLRDSVLQHRFVPLVGSGKYIQYLVHQDDLSELLFRIAQGRVSLDTPVTAACTRPWSLRQIVRELERRENKKTSIIPVPWQLMWAGLKSAEVLGLKMKFKSDSLISLVKQDPAPKFPNPEQIGIQFREFADER